MELNAALPSPFALKLMDDLRIYYANGYASGDMIKVHETIKQLNEMDVHVEMDEYGDVFFHVNGYHDWSDLLKKRLEFIHEKNFADADKIRDELAAQGIQLMDYKDPDTGERKTTWEYKRC